jgi:mono/diheme cytochrome c family protein
MWVMAWLACGSPEDTDGVVDTDVDTDTDTDTDADTDADADADTPAWTEVQAVFLDACAGCHYGEPAGLGFGSAPGNLIGVPSTQAPTMVRVDPGHLETSYLWRKLEGTHTDVGEGDRMPKGGTLPDADLDLIRRWILGGAPTE